MFSNFPFYKQLDSMDCGPTCLRMVAAYYGQKHTAAYLRRLCFTDKEGISLFALQQAALQIGFEAIAVEMPFDNGDASVASMRTIPLPCIVHWEQNHFVVVYKVSSKWVWVADPKSGKQKISRTDFEQSWCGFQSKGLALLLEPVESELVQTKGVQPTLSQGGFRFLRQYLVPYRTLIVQLLVGLFVGSMIQLCLPFLTQALVDTGIKNQDIDFIYLVLLGQLMLFLGRAVVEIIQAWILLHVGTRIHIHLIADFLKKLLRLPMAFFDNRHLGDLLQRVDDHQRVELFLTSTTLQTLFSVFYMVVFGLVLWLYHWGIFLIFLVSSILFLVWILLFLQKRRVIDHVRFEQLAANQNTLIEIIEGAQEIKLQNSEQYRRRKWAEVQAQLFQTSMRALRLNQYQDTGSALINQLKDILISFVAARAVIEGQMTLGMLLAVQFIVGQLGAPLYQFVAFIRLAQDAKISLERISEIHEEPSEEKEQYGDLPADLEQGIALKNVWFRYNPIQDWILQSIDLTIPKGKTTAIVGKSGSGKTTLLKLLLGFYTTEKGEIHIGGKSLQYIQPQRWRQQCGAVLADSFLFSDTLKNNIVEGTTTVDEILFNQTLQLTNVDTFVSDMPLGVETKITANASRLSQGQRQRILLARCMYKKPEFVFLDEATNALDVENERQIIANITTVFQGKTVVVVAHRLSTVQNADQIIVLQKGRIAEIGTHTTLLQQKGEYYDLVKNQLNF